MSRKRILIAGYGKLGKQLAHMLSKDHDVFAIKRSAPDPSPPDVKLICADLTRPRSLKDKIPADIDYLIYCVTPATRDMKGYQQVFVEGPENLLSAMPEGQKPRHLIFISSTAVYHQNDGSRVDEHSSTRPEGFNGQVLLQAEQKLSQQNFPVTIVRFSGIYGGSRSMLINKVRRGEAKLSPASRLTNRIHESDCAGFVCHLIQLLDRGEAILPCYLASDDCPAEYNEVLQFLATEMGQTLPDAAGQAPARGGDKRCNNRLMRDSGYRLRYPSYVEGYRAMLANPVK